MMNFAIIVSIALAAASALAADQLHIGKASPTSTPMLPADVGQKTGIFAKHGLEVEIANFSGGAKLHQAMAAGSVDVGVGAGPELALIAKGSPELAICNASAPAPFIGIALPKDSPVKKPDDLKGKKVGVTSTGSLTYWLAREFARTRGWGVEGVQTVAIGGDPAGIIAAFRAKAVDAAIVATPLAFQMEEQGEGRLFMSAAEYVGNISSGTIFATKEMMEKRPEVLRRFIAGWLETVDFMEKNRAETIKIAAGMTGFTQTVQAREYDLTEKMFTKDCKFDAESLANLKRSFADLKLLETEPDMSKLYTEAFLPKR
jgi:NitT/TauT family transport system substrate-binding protein